MKKAAKAIIVSGFFTIFSPGGWASDGGVLEDGGTGIAPVSIDATVTILSPEDGDTLDGPWIEVSFHVQGCQVNSSNQDPGGCHLAKQVDGENYSDPEGGGLGHYNPTPFQIHIGSAGSHEIGLILIRNDGTDVPFEPEISDSVTINVDIEAPPPEEEEEEEEEGGEYTAPIREKSEGGGCDCAASKSSGTKSGLLVLFCGGFIFFRRRRF